MTFETRHGHVSQLADHHDGTGLNGHSDCFEASLARWLREASYPFPGTDQELIAQIRLRATGRAETAFNPYTTIEEALSYLHALEVLLGYGPPTPRVPWSILLVRGVELMPRQYPPSWFNNQDTPDHFVLTLPEGWCNDPLAYWNGQKDTKYTTLVQACKDGYGFALKDPYSLVWKETAPGQYVAERKPVTPPAPPPLPVPHVLTTAAANVRSEPHLGASILALFPASTPLPLAHGAGKDPDAAPWYPVEIEHEGVPTICYISHLVAKRG